jgi:hypothetical protein
MLQVEILAKNADRDSKYVKINGILDEDSFYYDRYNGERHVILHDEKIIEEIILNCSPEDISIYFESLDFHWEIDLWEFWFTLKFNFKTLNNLESNSLKVEINIENEEWDRPYSIKKFADKINEISKNNSGLESQYYFDDEEFVTNGFGLSFDIKNDILTLGEIVDKSIEIVERYIQDAHLSLINKAEQDVFSAYFKFPDEIKLVCNQYLIYFAQFLSDMGIEVESEIRNELGGTLFKVMPKSADDALINIKEALDVYLYATSKSGYEIISESKNRDISLLQWKSNILHLQSQLMLAQSVIESKSATIEMLQLSNFQYQKMLGSQIEKKNEESIVGGLVKIKEYEGNGFGVDFPAIIRSLRRKLKI